MRVFVRAYRVCVCARAYACVCACAYVYVFVCEHVRIANPLTDGLSPRDMTLVQLERRYLWKGESGSWSMSIWVYIEYMYVHLIQVTCRGS